MAVFGDLVARFRGIKRDGNPFTNLHGYLLVYGCRVNAGKDLIEVHSVILKNSCP